MNLDDAFTKYTKLRSQFQLAPEAFCQHEELAQATLLILNDHLSSLNSTQDYLPQPALACYAEIASLAEANANNEIITYKFCVAGGNLISSLTVGRHRDQGLALRIYIELKHFFRRHAGGRASLSILAAIAAELVKPIGERDLGSAQGIYQDIKYLNDDHPDDEQIAIQLSRAALYLFELTRESAFDTAVSFYADLRALAETHTGIDAVVVDQCSAASMLLDERRKTSVIGARELYLDIRVLANARPDLMKLMLQQLQCCFHVLEDVAEEELNVGWEIFDDAEFTSQSHLDRQDVAYYYAAILFVWLVRLRQHEPSSVGQLLAKLDALGKAKANNPNLTDLVRRSKDLG